MMYGASSKDGYFVPTVTKKSKRQGAATDATMKFPESAVALVERLKFPLAIIVFYVKCLFEK